MPRFRNAYPPEFRRQMVELVRSGRTPDELAREFEPTARPIANWVRLGPARRGVRNCRGNLAKAQRPNPARLARRMRQIHRKSRIRFRVKEARSKAFSSEVDTGLREENAIAQRIRYRARLRSRRSPARSGSAIGPDRVHLRCRHWVRSENWVRLPRAAGARMRHAGFENLQGTRMMAPGRPLLSSSPRFSPASHDLADRDDQSADGDQDERCGRGRRQVGAGLRDLAVKNKR